eukprot:361740-Chlamydomonas_euryale.AAC.4
MAMETAPALKGLAPAHTQQHQQDWHQRTLGSSSSSSRSDSIGRAAVPQVGGDQLQWWWQWHNGWQKNEHQPWQQQPWRGHHECELTGRCRLPVRL